MPQQITCPHCRRQLKVADQYAGKVVACPACRGTLQIPAAVSRPQESSPPQGFSQPQGLSQPQGYSSQLQPSYFGPPARSGKKKRGAGLKLFVILASSLAGVAVVVTILCVVLLSSGSSIEEDLVYLPDNCNFVVSLRMDELVDSSLYREVKEPLLRLADMTGQSEVNEAFVEMEKYSGTVVTGIAIPQASAEFRPERLQISGVIRTEAEVTLEDMVTQQARAMAQFSEKEIDGRKMLVARGATGVEFAYYQVDSRTVAFGALSTLRSVLARGGPAGISPELQQALGEADLSATLAFAAALPDSLRNELGSQTGSLPIQMPRALIVQGDVDSDIHLSATLFCASSADADTIKNEIDEALSMAGNLGDPHVSELLGSVSVSTWESRVIASMTIRGSMIADAMNNLGSMRN